MYLKVSAKSLLKALSLLLLLNLQIDKEVRDDNPALFTNQRLYHAAPSPLFKDRNHILNFITDIPTILFYLQPCFLKRILWVISESLI